MKTKSRIIGVLAVSVSMALQALAGNPILKNTDPGFLYAADPAAEVFNGKVYVYCSRDQPDATGYSSMQDYMILETTNMVDWVNHGVVLEPRTAEGFEYASGQMNAPDCAYKDGWYYWYFPYDKTYVGVAKSQSPTGPWETAISGTEADGTTAAITTIFDPTVFVDDDGQAYIYGNDHKVNIGDAGAHLMGAKLKDNMVELDGDWHRLSERTVSEGVTIFKRDGVYYFMARRGWGETAYWMADNPLPYPGNPDGPATPVHNNPETGYASYQGLITSSAEHAVNAPSHMSAIEFKEQWYFFYHRGDVNNGSYVRRSACVDKMEFNADGTIQMIDFTLEEIVEPPTDPRGQGTMSQEAEDFSAQSGVTAEVCEDFGGGEEVGLIENGDWSAYTNINFGENGRGSIPFYVRASCNTSGGDVELYLDALDSASVGTITVTNTGGWDSYETFSTTLSGISGTHTLYLKYTGGAGYLLNINWFEWTPAQRSNLIAEWTFDNQTLANSGTSGLIHNGVVVGAEAYSSDTASGRGYALDLTDVSTYMRVSNSASGDAGYTNTFDSASFTYSMWVKHTDGDWTQWSEFGGKGNEDASEGWALRARVYDTGDSRNGTRVDFYKTTDDVAIDGDPFVDLTDQSWHLLTFTYDGVASNLNLYIDGVLEGADTSATMNSAAARALVFGARDDGTRGESLLIDNIQFYDGALSDLEVEFLYAPSDTITWGAATAVSTSSDVSTTGWLIEAFNAGDNGVSDQTVNGVLFTGTGGLLPNNTQDDVYSGDTGDPAYNALLSSIDYGGGKDVTLSLGGGNLVEGTVYSIQVWYVDTRSASLDQYFGDGDADTSNDVQLDSNPGQYAIGTFTASATGYQDLQIRSGTSNHGNIQITAYQIRNISTPRPVVVWAAGYTGLTDTDSTLDFDGGSLETGIEYVLDSDPTDASDDLTVAPTSTYTGTALEFDYRRSDVANDDPSTTIEVEYNSDLATSWTTAEHGIAGVTIAVNDDFYGAGIDQVVVSLPDSLAPESKLFARLKVTMVP